MQSTVFLNKCISYFLHVIFPFMAFMQIVEMSESFLRSAITEALPDLPEVSKDILQETLQSLGIETHDDLRFVKEEDLLSALRPIQARKLVAAWSLECESIIVVISYQHGYNVQLKYKTTIMSILYVCF